MKEKKTEVLTIRIPASTKDAIQREAEKREWSISKMAEKILSVWAQNQSVAKSDDNSINIHENTIQNINFL